MAQFGRGLRRAGWLVRLLAVTSILLALLRPGFAQTATLPDELTPEERSALFAIRNPEVILAERLRFRTPAELERDLAIVAGIFDPADNLAKVLRGDLSVVLHESSLAGVFPEPSLAKRKIDAHSDPEELQREQAARAAIIRGSETTAGSAANHAPQRGTRPGQALAGPPLIDGLVFADSDRRRLLGWRLAGVERPDPAFSLHDQALPAGWQVGVLGDFDRDGKADLLLQHDEGSLAVWFMNGPKLEATTLLDPPHPADRDWRVAGAADFNADGSLDLLFQTDNPNGMLGIWLMAGTRRISSEVLTPPYPGADWRVAAIADLNGDRKPDLVLQHQHEWLAGWLLDGTRLDRAVFLSPQAAPAGWRVCAAGELNHDGAADLLLQHSSGLVAAWLMEGATRKDTAVFSPHSAGPSYALLGTGDFTKYTPPDTDYDGRTDDQELVEGTDPFDPSDFHRLRLARFDFNVPDLVAAPGHAPLVAQSPRLVSSFEGNGLLVDTNQPSLVKFRDVELNGGANFNLRSGAIRFLFRPNWTSASGRGRGPGRPACFFEVGAWTPDAAIGCWGLYLSADGNRLSFITQTNGMGATLLNVPVSLFSNVWYEVILTYTPEASEVYITGSRYPAGPGVRFYPGPEIRVQGIALGSDSSGQQPIRGLIDVLETHNHPLGMLTVYENNNSLTATVAIAPPRVDLQWRFSPNQATTLQRRVDGKTNWLTLTRGTQWRYSDTASDLVPGQRYEYRLLPHGANIWTGSITVGLQATSRENRGRVLVLSDETLSSELHPEINQLTLDLIGDGWQVTHHAVPRHDDVDGTANPAKINRIKSIILSEVAADPGNVRAVYLLGHVAVPYSGLVAPDSHAELSGLNHYGAWPADGYYGDLDGLWTDSTADYINRHLAEQTNLPHDGKFDQGRYPTNAFGVAGIELAVGRVDFARLSSFDRASPPRNELALLRQYLGKAHAYRRNQWTLPKRVVADSFFYSGEDLVMYLTAQGIGSRLFGPGASTVIRGNSFRDFIPALWGVQGGYGHFDRVNLEATRDFQTTEMLTRPELEPPIAFHVLKGSFFGDWNTPNNLMRATLATPNYGLAAVWTYDTQWRFDILALGETLGQSFVRTINDNSQEFPILYTVLALLGDPTLRLHTSSPPGPVNAFVNAEGNVELSWEPSPDPGVGYHVFRAASLDNLFARLTSDPLRTHEFTDSAPPPGRKFYQIRTQGVIATGSGSFSDLSVGNIVVVEATDAD